jgi:hypothetical protein
VIWIKQSGHRFDFSETAEYISRMTKLPIWLKPVTPALCASVLLIAQCFAPALAETILSPEMSFFEETFGDMPEELATMAGEDKKASG